MTDKDKLIESLRRQLQKEMKKVSALEQENALLCHEIERMKAAKSARKL
ncbi:hypothetical protein JN06_01393 [Bacteroides zoogleoformans]|nr:hypothetical protein [Bacteroides zoogleoformans]TWJ14460.1 hypothetical protein JN06_01393 [Bacteroides zoogleoformans]